MIYKDQNWGFNDYLYNGELLNPIPFPEVVEGDVFISCNLSRSKPYTEIFKNIKDLTFINCNLTSVDLQPTWVLDDRCSYAQNEYIFEEEVSRLI
jgi:hypothetical protein